MPDTTVAALIERLADNDFATRKRAVAQLVQLGAPAVPALIAALDDPRLTVRVRSVEALGRIGAVDAAPALADRLAPPYLEPLQCELLIALTRLEARGASVARALADYDARAALDEGPPTRAELLAERDLADRIPIPAPSSGHRGAPTFTGDDPGALVGHLRSKDLATRKAAADRLVALGAAAVPALAAELAQRHPLSGPRAVQTLAETGDPAAVEPLVALRPGSDYDLVSARFHGLETLARGLCQRPFAEADLPAIARILGELPVYSVELLALAQYLARWAQTAPCPALRRVVKPLKGGLLRPMPAEVAAQRKAIDQATSAWKDLPLPATAPIDATNLPLPSEKPVAD